MQLLEHTLNRFNGIVIDPQALLRDPADFGEHLQWSVAQWQTEGRFLIWLEIPLERAVLIPAAVAAGFVFHHSQPHYTMMVHQLQPNALIPGYATHYIGIGGVVLNEARELLVVSEVHRSSARPYYKLPGGALHAGEHLAEAVVREVFEETGVRARFESLVSLRHWHGYRHGRSDIYFVARLAALSREICKQDDEIDDCLWMPVEDYLTSDLVGTFNREIVRAALEAPRLVPSWIDGYDDASNREFFFPPELARNHPPIPMNGQNGQIQ
ncbi:MAG: NUDIX domain-containing protein [Caldilineaceae bacterium]|nr:NUDIX domain-containing protein [Caldilineaceae bacterium]